jgi:hypothetical protein
MNWCQVLLSGLVVRSTIVMVSIENDSTVSRTPKERSFCTRALHVSTVICSMQSIHVRERVRTWQELVSQYYSFRLYMTSRLCSLASKPQGI